jgi:hypothetical protein
MQKAENKIWTHAIYLVIDAIGEEREPEASKLKIGAARLSGSRLHVELLPGLSVAGRLVFELCEDDD